MYDNSKGIEGVWKGYDIQVIETKPGDVILCHISADMDLDNYKAIHTELSKAFPENTILLVNEYVLKDINIIRPKNNIFDLTARTDMEEMFDKIIKELGPNDFLY